ncbi:MAG: TolC family protein [Acidobacteria bacterium]|nr:TolC family protein [Acidobacteriota bacterium]
MNSVAVLTLFCFLTISALGQSAASPELQSLDLPQAEAQALVKLPRMLAAQARARAISERVRQARSGYLPMVNFNATGAQVADTSSAVSAGNLTTSALSGRFAYGGNLTQLVTDFGRTGALVSAARFTAEAQADAATLTRAQVRLNVRMAYYRVLGAEAVLRAAQAALANRRLVSRQLSALAQSELRSTLDVNFARVLESEAELAVVRAQSTVAQERSQLAIAMGQQQSVVAKLIDVASVEPLPPAPEDLMQQAQAKRADLAVLQAQQHAAQQFAQSEKRLSYPTLNLQAAAGQLPYHDRTLHDDYAAAGFNLSIPVFNGGLFAARRSEAEFEATARAHDVQDRRLQVGDEVRSAWYRADEAFRSIDVTARLVAQSKEALRLAQDRYDAGLGSIVELNEAQLNETSAEITAADATYTYLTRLAQLDFATGNLN